MNELGRMEITNDVYYVISDIALPAQSQLPFWGNIIHRSSSFAFQLLLQHPSQINTNKKNPNSIDTPEQNTKIVCVCKANDGFRHRSAEYAGVGGEE